MCGKIVTSFKISRNLLEKLEKKNPGYGCNLFVGQCVRVDSNCANIYQSHYRPGVPTGFQEVKVLRLTVWRQNYFFKF